jgi:DNA-binding NarL/FixJ family response regulator
MANAGDSAHDDITRVAIVDDDLFVRTNLAQLLPLKGRVKVVGLYADGAEAVDGIEADPPDVVLMDVAMPGMDGVEATALIRDRAPEVQVVALTSLADHDVVAQMLRAGAIGYLYKDTPIEGLAHAVITARFGMSVVPAKTAAAIAEQVSSGPAGPTLSPIERRILRLVCDGLTNDQIAAQVNFSPSMVKYHIRVLMKTFGVPNRVRLAVCGDSLDLA